MLTKSFFYGIVVASITWAVSIYLFYNLQDGPTKLALKSAKNFEKSRNVHLSMAVKELSTFLYRKFPNRSVTNLFFLDNVVGMIKNDDDLRAREYGYKTYAFNSFISESLDLNRSIADTRHEL